MSNIDKNKPPRDYGKHTTIDRQVELFHDVDEYVDTHNPNGPTSIFLAVVQSIGLRFSQWTQLLREWEYCPSSAIRNTRNARTHARSNLNKDLLNPHGTWDAMIKLLKAIRVCRIDLQVTCHFNWRKPTTVNLSFDTGVPTTPLSLEDREVLKQTTEEDIDDDPPWDEDDIGSETNQK